MNKTAVEKLTSLMEKLRSPDGCPWDREQTLKTLIPFIIEEAYEVVDAIESGKKESLKEELGDLLFQIVFASQLAKEKGWFGLTDVIEDSVEKMIKRHPHVFEDMKLKTSEEVLLKWDEIKKTDKREEGRLSTVPHSFPALLRAHKVGKIAGNAGFDWETIDGAMEKVEEELKEFKEALLSKDRDKTEEELGDMLFSLVNLSRFVEVNPEEALRKTIGKFIRRFHYVEKILEEKGMGMEGTALADMEKLWKQAKAKEKR